MIGTKNTSFLNDIEKDLGLEVKVSNLEGDDGAPLKSVTFKSKLSKGEAQRVMEHIKIVHNSFYRFSIDTPIQFTLPVKGSSDIVFIVK